MQLTSFVFMFIISITMNAAEKNFFDFEVDGGDGKKVQLSQYKGKTILAVNVASKCGYTKQYDGLEKLYEKYKDKGLVVLGFPSNDFGAQEPGTDAEIQQFCKLNFGVTFPVFKKKSVKGAETQPVYQFLTTNAQEKGEVKWNFEKFLIGPQGKVVGRFNSKVEPLAPELTAEVEKLISK